MRAHHLALGLLTLNALSLTACRCGGTKSDDTRTNSTAYSRYDDGTYRTAAGDTRYDAERRYEAEHRDDTHATTTPSGSATYVGQAGVTYDDRYVATHTAGAAVRPNDAWTMPGSWDRMTTAAAAINPTRGNTCHGTVRFTKTADGVRVVADLEGLQPRQKYGFHVHEFGDCSSPTGESVGDHFNPRSQQHGAPSSAFHHAGDLGNVESDANGRAHVDITVGGLSIAGGDDSILGRAVVVHEKPDDMTTQPSGDSGSKLGCGTIGVARTAPVSQQ